MQVAEKHSGIRGGKDLGGMYCRGALVCNAGRHWYRVASRWNDGNTTFIRSIQGMPREVPLVPVLLPMIERFRPLVGRAIKEIAQQLE